MIVFIIIYSLLSLTAFLWSFGVFNNDTTPNKSPKSSRTNFNNANTNKNTKNNNTQNKINNNNTEYIKSKPFDIGMIDNTHMQYANLCIDKYPTKVIYPINPVSISYD